MKYVGKKRADHLVSVIKEHCDVTENWGGMLYLGLTFSWGYVQQRVHLSMLGYITNALKRFNREKPKKWQSQPHIHTPPNYGSKKQSTIEELDEPMLGDEDKKYPVSAGNLLVLCALHGQHHACSPERNCVRSSTPYQINNGKGGLFFRLCSITRGSSFDLPREQRGACRPLR